MRVHTQPTPMPTNPKVTQVEGLFKRAFGIRWYPVHYEGCLLFKRCTSIHTLGLKAPIAIFAFDSHGKLLLQEPRVMPNRIVTLPRNTVYLFEVYSSSAPLYSEHFFINYLEGKL